MAVTPSIVDRRAFLPFTLGSSSASTFAGFLPGRRRHEALANSSRIPIEHPTDGIELIRYATLAASGHNTQPWLFRASEQAIYVEPNFARRTPVVDPDDHHLYASLGCAAENLSIAARATGRAGDVRFDELGTGRIRVGLAPIAQDVSPLFRAIPYRQVNRSRYEGRTTPADVVERLIRAAAVHDVKALPVTESHDVEVLLELIVEGNSRQVDDPHFIAELEHWLRFNAAAANRTRDGLFAACAGNPSLPSWLGPMVFRRVFTRERENDKCAQAIRSSSGLVVFSAATDDPAGWVDAGRAYERFALQATLEGIQHAFVNQAVEQADIRQQVQGAMSLGHRRSNLIVRFGYGSPMPRSLRRPVQQVML